MGGDGVCGRILGHSKLIIFKTGLRTVFKIPKIAPNTAYVIKPPSTLTRLVIIVVTYSSSAFRDIDASTDFSIVSIYL